MPSPPPIPARTLARPATVEGVGLFCPDRCRVTLKPAPPGAGVCFIRTDLPGSPAIAAVAAHVRARPRQTVLAASRDAGAPSVQTVEHLLSALAGVGISDALVEVHGPEVPLADGSAKPFTEAILGASVTVAATGTIEPIVVSSRIEVTEGDARIVALPAAGSHLDLTYDLDYGDDAPMPAQSAYYRLEYVHPDPAGYLRDIAPARTFCTEAEAQALRAAGMFTHLGPGDVVVLGDAGPVGCTLRFANEPARHKLLDVMGDLALAGRPIFARINASRSGHALNHRMAMALASV